MIKLRVFLVCISLALFLGIGVLAKNTSEINGILTARFNLQDCYDACGRSCGADADCVTGCRADCRSQSQGPLRTMPTPTPKSRM